MLDREMQGRNSEGRREKPIMNEKLVRKPVQAPHKAITRPTGAMQRVRTWSPSRAIVRPFGSLLINQHGFDGLTTGGR